MVVAIVLHVLAAVVWVGGMFFALLVLRPAALALEPPLRLSLWRWVFRRFFSWVWIAIALLLASGYWMIFADGGGFENMPIYLHMMQGIGWLMVLIYMYLWFVPYKRFKLVVVEGALPEAGRYLNQIRWIVMINLGLGLINVIIGASGKYW